MNARLLLILAVAAVGVLHTIVPDHWAPISLLARRQGWSRARAGRAAIGAGLGHTLSTLAIAVVVWAAGVAVAARFGHLLTIASSLALMTFGGWIALGAWREIHTPLRHTHRHRHADGRVHVHAHEHAAGDWHSVEGSLALAPAEALPIHEHEHAASGRTALLLILGSSPMIEGIPAFFAAAKFGVGQLAIMSAVFAFSTIATYFALVWLSLAGLERLSFGSLERYGEVLSGGLIAALGFAFLFIPGL